MLIEISYIIGFINLVVVALYCAEQVWGSYE
jgi:hypothetical protein